MFLPGGSSGHAFILRVTAEPFDEPFVGIVRSGTEFGSIGLRAGKLMEDYLSYLRYLFSIRFLK